MSSFRPERVLPAPRLVTTLLALLVVLGAVLLTAPRARAADDSVRAAAEALRKDPVYVDPAMRDQLSKTGEKALERRIKDAGKPVLVAVLPAGTPKDQLFRDLATLTGVDGVYAVRLGSAFDARASTSAMSGAAVDNAVATVRGEDLPQQLDDFTGIALRTVQGEAPAAWGGDRGGSTPVVPLVVAGAAVLLVGGALALARRARRRREREREAALARLRGVVDEDITAFGEELDRLDFHPAEAGADDTRRADYERALNAYDQAKSLMAGARLPEDVRGVTEALEDGRFSLATLEARRTGAALPDRRPPCFFDPRHGPSVADAAWAPRGGKSREVPVCAADAARLADGKEPLTRTVPTAEGPRPYWDAGPAYGPWAGGYFGGGLLPALLIGTTLGSLMDSPAYGAQYGTGDGDDRGDGPGDGGDGGSGDGGASGDGFDPSGFGDFGGGGNGSDLNNSDFGGF